MLLPYQARWVKDRSQVKIIEKSRRIGLSWAHAAIAVLNAAKARGRNCFYIGYNKEMARQFIKDCAYWARAYKAIGSEIKIEIIEEEDKSIFVYRIEFLSSFQVEALSSRPSNLRSKKGDIVCDEFAFHESPEELLKAALATLTWGFDVAIISTHDGIHNRFNTLIQESREKKVDYSLHRITFKQAIAEGLYKRICLVNNERWSFQKEIEWEKKIRGLYGIAATEELDCIPMDVKGGGKIFKKEWFKIVDRAPQTHYKVRFWDMAATSGEIKSNAYFTAGVLMSRHGDDYFVHNTIAEQLPPTEGDELILETARSDGNRVAIRWELEGGSAGLKYESYLKNLLFEFDAEGIRPRGDKVTRAMPVGSHAKRGHIHLVRGNWNEQLINALFAFDGTSKPLTNDLTDATSGAWDCLQFRQNTLYEALVRSGQL